MLYPGKVTQSPHRGQGSTKKEEKTAVQCLGSDGFFVYFIFMLTKGKVRKRLESVFVLPAAHFQLFDDERLLIK